MFFSSQVDLNFFQPISQDLVKGMLAQVSKATSTHSPHCSLKVSVLENYQNPEHMQGFRTHQWYKSPSLCLVGFLHIVLTKLAIRRWKFCQTKWGWLVEQSCDFGVDQAIDQYSFIYCPFWEGIAGLSINKAKQDFNIHNVLRLTFVTGDLILYYFNS